MTSSEEILERVPGADVVLYSDLGNNLEDLFKNSDRVLILYEAGSRIGHWVCLIRNGNYLEFFDPYGGMIDSQLLYSDLSRKEGCRLLKLLLDFDGDLYFNHFAHQEMSPDIQTCGMHCGMRMENFDLDMYQYNRMMSNMCDELSINPDEIVKIWWKIRD